MLAPDDPLTMTPFDPLPTPFPLTPDTNTLTITCALWCYYTSTSCLALTLKLITSFPKQYIYCIIFKI